VEELSVGRAVAGLALFAFYSVVMLLGVVALIVWLYQARSNVDALPGAKAEWARGWTIGAWFVPVANLFLVPAVFADVVRESAGAAATRAVRLTVLWWVTWLVGSLIQANAMADGSIESVIAAATFGVVSACSLLYVMWQVSAAQERRVAVARGTTPIVAAPLTDAAPG
jgi:hypothetical protein